MSGPILFQWGGEARTVRPGDVLEMDPGTGRLDVARPPEKSDVDRRVATGIARRGMRAGEAVFANDLDPIADLRARVFSTIYGIPRDRHDARLDFEALTKGEVHP